VVKKDNLENTLTSSFSSSMLFSIQFHYPSFTNPSLPAFEARNCKKSTAIKEANMKIELSA
jgi:hypothetical protein